MMRTTTINKFNRYFRYKYNFYYNNFKITMPLHLPLLVFANKVEWKKISKYHYELTLFNITSQPITLTATNKHITQPLAIGEKSLNQVLAQEWPHLEKILGGKNG